LEHHADTRAQQGRRDATVVDVDIPEPEGPMSAVTWFLGTSKLASRIAVRPLNDTATSSSRMQIGPERGSAA